MEDRTGAAGFAPETSARVRVHENDVRERKVELSGETGSGLRDTLRRWEDVKLAVLPVRHAASCFERMVRLRLVKERLIDDQVCLSEAGVDVADDPFFFGLSER